MTTKKTRAAIGDIIILSYMSVILFAVQYILAFAPNIELVSLLVMIFTLVYRRKVLYIIYVFAVLEGLLYGFSIWWITYLYVWTILAGVTHLFRRTTSPMVWAIVAGAYGLMFGALCEIPWLITMGYKVAFAAWVAGIPFDLVHGIGNFVLTLFLFRPLSKLLFKLEDIRISRLQSGV